MAQATFTSSFNARGIEDSVALFNSISVPAETFVKVLAEHVPNYTVGEKIIFDQSTILATGEKVENLSVVFAEQVERDGDVFFVFADGNVLNVSDSARETAAAVYLELSK